MSVYYSAKTGGFYRTDIRLYPDLPADAVEITEEYQQVLLVAQASGASIVPDENGVPQMVLLPPPTEVEVLDAWRATAKVSRFQAMAALHNEGLLDEAVEVVTQAGGLIKIAWDNAIEFRRNSPAILNLALALGLDEEELDALFIVAAEIEA